MVLEAYVFNLFNQEAVTNITTRYNRNGSMPQAFASDLYAGTLGDATQYRQRARSDRLAELTTRSTTSPWATRKGAG